MAYAQCTLHTAPAECLPGLIYPHSRAVLLGLFPENPMAGALRPQAEQCCALSTRLPLLTPLLPPAPPASSLDDHSPLGVCIITI